MRITTDKHFEANSTLRIIKGDEEYRHALAQAEILVALDPRPGTAEADRLEVLTLLIEDYESRQFPFEIPDPVDAITFRMEEQQLLQKDLVPFIGSRSRVSEVLARKRPLTVQMIRALASGLGIPLNALVGDPGMRRSQAATAPTDPEWGKFPFKEMLKRGWFAEIKASNDGNAVETIKAFFARVAASPSVLYRRTFRGENLDERAYYSTLAWTARVMLRAKAAEKSLAQFDRARLSKDVLRELACLSWLDDGPKIASQFLAKIGIHMVVEPRLPNTLLDGAALLTEQGTPIVALTLRIDRVDYFWFTLLHEVVHVWKHLRSADEAFVDRVEADESPERVEQEANRMARDAFVPHSGWKRSEAYLNPSRQSILDTANQWRVHPALIAGRLQRETGRYQLFREYLGQGTVRKHFPEVTFS
jgi:HTH-type transcriptional regulator/antitoxin HigA